MILAGDIGGTHSRLLACDAQGNELASHSYASRNYTRLEDVIHDFSTNTGYQFQAACFGLPGPVIEGRCRPVTIATWDEVDAKALSAATGIGRISLINDVEANAYGVLTLRPEEYMTLNPGKPVKNGAVAVVSPGTGLGEAAVLSVDGRPVAMPSEGGHADFGPLNDLEYGLLRHVQQEYECISYELLLSGAGLTRMHDFLHEHTATPAPPWLAEHLAVEDKAAVIGEMGVAGSDDICRQAVDLWVSILAAEAANAALKFFAVGGVFIGGGIAPKLRERLTQPHFMARFTRKDKMAGVLADIPVHLILEDKTALRGVLTRALQLVSSRENSLC